MKFKKGDRVTVTTSSHYYGKRFIVVFADTRKVHLRGVRSPYETGNYLEWFDSELEHWDIFNSPLYKALQ